MKLTLVSVVATALLLSACATSVSSLEGAVDTRAGVVGVDVQEAEGDDTLPFTRVPKYVSVRMEAAASAEEVAAVFHAYDDDIDDGDVGSVEVSLEGPKDATLSAGEEVHVTRAMVDDLVAAQADPTIVGYHFEAYPVLPMVSIVLGPTDFDGVVAAADRYRGWEDLEAVEVTSGDFVLIRDEGNEDLRVTDARQAVVHQVAARFELRGAIVAGRGPLELIVAPADVRAVRRLAAAVTSDERLVRRIVVDTSRRRA